MAKPDLDLDGIEDAGLARSLKGLHAAMKANPRPEAPPPESNVVQLPLWAQAAPGAPNPALRGALFPAIQGKDRQMLNDVLVASVEGQQIKVKGEQLNQEDLEVWLAVLNLCRSHPLGDICHSSAHALLRAMDRGTGNTQHRQLDASLMRLAQPVQIKGSRYSYVGGLVMEVVKDERDRHYLIQVNPKLAHLFGQEGWTKLDTATRRQLRGKPLALWLQAHYATHREPFPYSVTKLRDLSGSRTKDLKAFRQNLRQALPELQRVGAIWGWEIDARDLVHVYKVPTVIQHPGN